MGVVHSEQQTKALIERGIERIRELSPEGIAPSTAEFNANRGTAPSADYMRRKGYPWPKLLEMAGVKGLKPGSKEGKRQNIANSVPEVLEAEIQAARHRGDHWPRHWHSWGLTVIPTRCEVTEIPLPDGSGVYRVTREYASIR